jgi:tRNA A37 threonylcarbamoyladenosine biosynthesis protein TsaE
MEWPDRLADALPADRVDVRIDGRGDAPRTIRLEGHGASGSRYVVAAVTAGAAS